MGLDLWAFFLFFYSMLRLPLFKLLWFWFLFSSMAMGLTIQSLDPEIHDWNRSQDIDTGRTGSKQFIGYNFDWSGVGRSSDGRWATMIGPRNFLSANHFKPGNGSTITYFIRDFGTGAISTATATVTGGQRIGTTDLWVGEIDSQPVGVTWYDIFSGSPPADYAPKGNLDLNSTLPRLDLNPDEVTEILFVVGRSGLSGTNSFRVGLNSTTQYSEIQQFNFGSGSSNIGDAAIMEFDEESVSFSNFTDYEAFFESGDSGAPTLYAPGTNTDTINGSGAPSELLVFGIHAGRVPAAGLPEDNDIMVDTLPGQYLTEIDALLVPIPEPRFYGILLTGICLLSLFFCYRRPEG